MWKVLDRVWTLVTVAPGVAASHAVAASLTWDRQAANRYFAAVLTPRGTMTTRPTALRARAVGMRVGSAFAPR